MNFRTTPWSGGSRRLILVFLALLVPAAVTLVWLGVRLLDEDRTLLAERRRERQEALADDVERGWTQLLSDADRLLGDRVPLAGALRVDIESSGLDARPRQMIPWSPVSERLPEAASDSFSAAESLEFQGRGADALRQYQQFATSRIATVRAGALIRIARVHRQAARVNLALAAYERLAGIRNVAADGMPVDLLARRAACDVLSKAGGHQELSARARAIEADLLAGRWALDRSGWELSISQVETWLGRPVAIPTVNKALAEAVHWLWDTASRQALPPTGRRLLLLENVPLTVIWRRDGGTTSAFLLPPDALAAWWQSGASGNGSRAAVAFDVSAGELVVGRPLNDEAFVRRTPDQSGLPWPLAITPGDESEITAEFAARRRLLGFGFGAIVLLIAGGSHLLWRIVQRELAVARLQAEFVSAVSHEFRTPLTSLTHVTELLQEDDDARPEQRQAFYQVLARNTERLHHLVESLLDFARMEAGRKPYDLRPMDLAAFVRAISEDFRQDAASRGLAVDIEIATEPAPTVQADAVALGHALWNLLDNAVKYSPDRAVVEIGLRPHPRGVCIAVRDHGIGIPRHERAEIFAKFVRGEQARLRGIKGTGVGLAIVAHIIEAHGGAIELNSEEGKGSTFSVMLPAVS